MLAHRLHRVASDLLQYEPLRKRARAGGAAMLELRGLVTERVGRQRPLRNVYGVGMQKTGSQWAKALLGHEIVVAASGLATFPTLAYSGDRSPKRFPAHCFVPDLFMSYPDYSSIPKPAPYRTYYLMRDPRDIVVSWYFSTRDTHRVFGPIAEIREELVSRSVDDGLRYAIEWLAEPLSAMATWVDVSEPEVAVFRLEDIRDRPEAEVRRLLTHCRVELTPEEFAHVLQDTSRDALQKRDLERRAPGEESHYRREASEHVKFFGVQHHQLFLEVNGDLLERLGYG